jgi:hypothetical protein
LVNINSGVSGCGHGVVSSMAVCVGGGGLGDRRRRGHSACACCVGLKKPSGGLAFLDCPELLLD